MQKRKFAFGIAFALSLIQLGLAGDIDAAHDVIKRFAGGKQLPVELKKSDSNSPFPYYEAKVVDNMLMINGSSGVSVCKGFYDYVRSNGLGISSWSGNRLDWKTPLVKGYQKKVVSPFRDHYYFNVVTYGYTMPYWDWARWEKEIDWMALHGMDMPLALVAQEAITARVFKKLGLTDDEISNYFVGPAHLPWMRMGNISGIDGPLQEGWHKNQVQLQHKILKRMRSLGMKPICPGFAGFVPEAIKRIYPDVNIVQTRWAGAFKNWMLSPEQDLFVTIGEMFIKEWEKEFGKNNYYLVDSFNEMEIPFPPHGTKERTDLLENYGKQVYKSIKNGNPDAVWVMQGWMFGYQRNIWDQATLGALVKAVPNDKMILLDLAVDYNKHFWHNGYNWDLHKGFYNKEWVYSVIPNMGGKSGHTGVLEFYANGHLEALKSPNKGNLVGFGMAPEGIENNEVIYELLADAGWTDQPIDLNKWLAQYDVCRYGKNTEQLTSYWNNMLKSVYGSFTDHPRFNWQFRPGNVRRGSIKICAEYDAAMKDFLAAAPSFKKNRLYLHDLQEMGAMYLGGKLELLSVQIEEDLVANRKDEAKKKMEQFKTIMLGMDRLLVSHPTLTLNSWLKNPINLDKQSGGKHGYEKNARRLVTIWGPPVDDYAARIWSGLIRDYYWPRWDMYFQNKLGAAHNISAWEHKWVTEMNGVSALKPYPNIVEAAASLIDYADKAVNGTAGQDEGVIGQWSQDSLQAESTSLEFGISMAQVKKAKGIKLTVVQGDGQNEIVSAKLIMDGQDIPLKLNSDVLSSSKKNVQATWSLPAGVTGNNESKLVISVKKKNDRPLSVKVSLLP